MSTASKPEKVQLTSVVAQFWQIVEQKGKLTSKTEPGVEIAKSKYFGLRPDDTIIFPIKLADGTMSERRQTITNLWRAFCSKNRIATPDLVAISRKAVAEQLLHSSPGALYTDSKTGEKRRTGLNFWTPTNPVYVSKRTANPRGEYEF